MIQSTIKIPKYFYFVKYFFTIVLKNLTFFDKKLNAVKTMLNENIKKLRLLRSISQVELAHALNVSKQCVSNWENDNIQPSIEMLVRIAKYFDVSTDYLLDLDNQNRITVEGLSETQIEHIKLLIQDLKSK